MRQVDGHDAKPDVKHIACEMDVVTIALRT